MPYILELFPDKLAICRSDQNAALPDIGQISGYYALIQTPNETTLICPEKSAPEFLLKDSGWRALEVQGPLEFNMIGVLSELAGCLARASVSIFVISTYDTDTILVKDQMLANAVQALISDGHQVVERSSDLLGTKNS